MNAEGMAMRTPDTIRTRLAKNTGSTPLPGQWSAGCRSRHLPSTFARVGRELRCQVGTSRQTFPAALAYGVPSGQHQQL